jgi:hypothetical protein
LASRVRSKTNPGSAAPLLVPHAGDLWVDTAWSSPLTLIDGLHSIPAARGIGCWRSAQKFLSHELLFLLTSGSQTNVFSISPSLHFSTNYPVPPFFFLYKSFNWTAKRSLEGNLGIPFAVLSFVFSYMGFLVAGLKRQSLVWHAPPYAIHCFSLTMYTSS